MTLTATTYAGLLAADADAYTRMRGRHIRAHLYITPHGLEYRSNAHDPGHTEHLWPQP